MSSTQSAAAPSEPASPPSEPTAGPTESVAHAAEALTHAAEPVTPAAAPAAGNAPVVIPRRRTVRLTIIRTPPRPPLPPLEEFGTGDDITPVQIAAHLRTASDSAHLANAAVRTAMTTYRDAYNSALHAYQGNAQPPISDEARRTFSALLRDMQHVVEVLQVHESLCRAVRHRANSLADELQ
ncbi:hypothetical protein DENSPDRAFT_887433 [Dentipellis sp. KUC8613]|nr:hypothetical protein DENSPDRAFT_887433 [Dentipellis sp. KUC8613]